MARVAIALGSNLGDRHATLRHALDELAGFIAGLTSSSFHDTEPLGVDPQPRFLNAAAVGETDLEPRDLLRRLLALEQRFGRERPYDGAPRTLDLDLILYADRRIDEPGLSVPHPRFRDREFVLAPLAEIAGEWIDPVTGLTISALESKIRGAS